MKENTLSIYWEAPEHNHIEKSTDWYWAMSIIAVAGAITSITFNNVLFGMVILLAAATIFITGNRKPRTIPFEVTTRGIRIDDDFYAYTTLESWCIDEENPMGPQLIVKSKKLLMTLIILPLPEEYIHSVERLIAIKLPQEHLREPLSHKLLEFLGF
jgi:hypothetical protein